MVTAGLQSLFSSSRERHTVPEGYTFGWNRGGSNLPAANTHTHTHTHSTRTAALKAIVAQTPIRCFLLKTFACHSGISCLHIHACT